MQDDTEANSKLVESLVLTKTKLPQLNTDLINVFESALKNEQLVLAHLTTKIQDETYLQVFPPSFLLRALTHVCTGKPE